MSPEHLFEFIFPDIGEGLSEGKVLALKVAPGQQVRQGETLAVVETDKVVADIPSPRDGILVSFTVKEGDLIKVGSVLATIRVGGAEERTETSLVGELSSAGPTELPPSIEGRAPREDHQEREDRPVAASPVARKLAAERGMDLAGIRGTGPGGRVLVKDLEAAAVDGARKGADRTPAPESPAVKPQPSSRVQPLSTLRKTLASNMERSHAIPTAVIHELVRVEELVRLRRELNEESGPGDSEARLSFMAFFVKVAALALREHPLMNAAYHAERQEVEQFAEVNVGIAVDTEDGLQVPVIRQADALSLERIQAEVNQLAAAARGRALRLEQLRGGTFTLTNYGAFAGIYGQPLILPPQVGILGIGRIHDQPAARGGAWTAAPHLPLSLVFDHRVMDGMYAGRFLRRFMDLAARPQELIRY